MKNFFYQSLLYNFIIFLLVSSSTPTQAQLSGTYTIGGASPDYNTVVAAVNDLTSQGVNGDVTFDIRDGTYTGDSIYIKTVSGADQNNIVFQSESNDSGTVTITGSPAVRLDSFAQNINFKALTFKSSSTVIDINDGPHYISFKRCHFVATSSDIVDIDGGDVPFQGSHIKFMGSEFTNGNDAVDIDCYGSPCPHIYIVNNQFSNQSSDVIETEATDTLYVINNRLEGFGSYGLYLEYGRGITEVRNNYMYSSSGSEGIDHYEGYDDLYVINNYISIPSSTAEGYYLDYLNGSAHFYYNTIRVGAEPVYGYFDKKTYFYNNILISLNGYEIFDLDENNGTTILPEADNNAMFTSGDIAYLYDPYSQSYSTLNDWQQVSGQDKNSFILPDGTSPFNNPPTDLHTCSDTLKNGQPFSQYNRDYDGDPRSPKTPFIGADEAPIPGGDFLGVDRPICNGETITLRGPTTSGGSYTWQPGGQNTQSISVSQAGTHTLEINSTCGTATDTIEVYNAEPTFQVTQNRSYYTVYFNNQTLYADSFYWDFDDGTSSTEKEPYHVYDQAGDYTITMQAFGPCGMKDTSFQVTATGIDKKAAQLGVMLFPNPIQDQLNIRWKSATNIRNIQLISAQGKVVREWTNLPTQQSSLKANLSTLPTGLYVVRVHGNHAVSNHKLLKK